MSTIKVDTIQNTSGVEQYLAKAWVNFNGRGTVAIRADGNVSSITDDGVGLYTLNFATSFANADYSPTGTTAWLGAGLAVLVETSDTSTGAPTSKLSSAVRVNCATDSNTHTDISENYWNILG